MLRPLVARPLALCAQVRFVGSVPAALARPTAEYYQTVLEKHTSGMSIAKRDLRHILVQCHETNDWHHALRTVSLYERCNADFNDELCRYYVEIALNKNKADRVAGYLTKPTSRMCAYLSKRPLSALVVALLDKSRLIEATELLNAVHSRGIGHIIDPALVARAKVAARQLEAGPKTSRVHSLLRKVSPQ